MADHGLILVTGAASAEVVIGDLLDRPASRADCDGIAYKIPEDRSEIPGISVLNAPPTNAM